MNNNVISQRPSWVNTNISTNVNIHNRWSNVMQNRPPGFATTLPAERRYYWNQWGGGVRTNWNSARYHNCFNDHWWSTHYHGVAGWHYCYHYNRYPWAYWWRRPAWTAFGTWFVWSAQYPAQWSQPVYYDYGTGGNVIYQDNSVYLGDQRIASAEEFAMSAADLATVPPPESQEVAEAEEWMPLGTFALSTSKSDVDPTRILQLAVNRQGILSGTLYNSETDVAQTIQGQVDQQTQRVAFRIGESENVIAETGLYNLTQDEAPLLVHFGPDRVETYLLIRLEEPVEK